jgi:uncharacterized membrane protein YccC
VRPALFFGLQLWTSVYLALYIAYWLQLDNAFWAGTSASIVCQPHLGASLRKGWYRMVGTVVGAVVIVVLTGCFPQQRAAFLVGLLLWCALCALVTTLLRNFAAYSAALAGYTAAIVAYDQLGATGGPNGQAFMLAITRVSEICIGIVSAGVVLAGSDFGAAPRRVAARLAALSVQITHGFTDMFSRPGLGPAEAQSTRRELIRRIIELDPVIDEALGESSRLRYHSPVLQKAVDGLLAAVESWRTVATHFARLAGSDARQEAQAILRNLPRVVVAATKRDEPTRWTADAIRLREACLAAARTLRDLPVRTPSLRLLGDQTARVLAGISHALDGLALLAGDPDRRQERLRSVELRVPDWLPAFVNAGRAFVTIAAVALVWIATSWPYGALAMLWTAIPVILFSPRADQAYASTVSFMVGNLFAAVCAAIIGFALLPGVVTFEGFCVVLGLYLIPVGALMAKSWQPVMIAAMATNFVPLLAPANQMSYDTADFYNRALAIIAGNGAAALSFRLLPPLSADVRTRRLLVLMLRDLRRLATGPVPESSARWESRARGRLLALPDDATPLQRARLGAAITLGIEIVQLRRLAPNLTGGPEVTAALAALAEGRGETAIAHLDAIDRVLAARSGAGPETVLALRTRGSILVIRETLMDHTSYFDAARPA